jgi:hypothetical protein
MTQNKTEKLSQRRSGALPKPARSSGFWLPDIAFEIDVCDGIG